MREVWIFISLVECLVLLFFLTFVETTNIINGPDFQKSHEQKHSILAARNDMISEQGYNILQLGGKRLRKKRRLPGTSSHVRKHTGNHLKKGFKKESDGFSDENKPELKKRDLFFTPASPYSQMMNPIDRRMFLVHRGERGPCFFHACHHGGMCIPRRHGFYCECLPGFMGTKCEVKKECKSTTCNNGGTCTEIAIGRHLCTCPVGFLGDNCEERSFCHPNPCRNGGTCSQIDESYGCVCEEGYKGMDCEVVNKCSPNPCKNAGICSESNNDFICNCPQGFKGKTCEVISECNSVYCLNGGLCRDEPTGYHCDCHFGFYGKRCEASACHPNPCHNDRACLRFGNQYFCQCKQGFSGKRCKVKGACSAGLCLNGGTCVDGSYTNSRYGFACICLRGYDGIICEKHLPQEETLDEALVAL